MALICAQICVSNASFSQRDNFLDMDWDSAQRTFEVTQFGAMHVCQFAAKQMVAQGDMPADRPGTYKIVLITSVMADLPHLIPSSFSYNMAKASLDAMTKSMASGMAQHSITVNAVHPTAGEDIDAGHEIMARAALPHQDFGIMPVANRQHNGRRNARARGFVERLTRRPFRIRQVHAGDFRRFHRV